MIYFSFKNCSGLRVKLLRPVRVPRAALSSSSPKQANMILPNNHESVNQVAAEVTCDPSVQTGYIIRIVQNKQNGFIARNPRAKRGIYFSFSHVIGEADSLQQSDCVQYTVATDPQSGRKAAMNIVKVASSDMRLKSAQESDSKMSSNEERKKWLRARAQRRRSDGSVSHRPQLTANRLDQFGNEMKTSITSGVLLDIVGMDQEDLHIARRTRVALGPDGTRGFSTAYQQLRGRNFRELSAQAIEFCPR